MTQRKRSPRKAANSLLSFKPAGPGNELAVVSLEKRRIVLQSISHARVRCRAATEYNLSISLIDSAIGPELSIM